MPHAPSILSLLVKSVSSALNNFYNVVIYYVLVPILSSAIKGGTRTEGV
jgi:hypothetical protein